MNYEIYEKFHWNRDYVKRSLIIPETWFIAVVFRSKRYFWIYRFYYLLWKFPIESIIFN